MPPPFVLWNFLDISITIFTLLCPGFVDTLKAFPWQILFGVIFIITSSGLCYSQYLYGPTLTLERSSCLREETIDYF